MANPLIDPPPADFRLRAAPLERVLAAIAFPPILKIGDPSGQGVSDFQDRIRDTYPFLEAEQENALQLQAGPDGSLQSAVIQKPIWRFYDAKRQWRVTLAQGSVALETQRDYTIRSDYLGLLATIIKVVAEVYRPAAVTRLGFRYLNVFGPKKFSRLADYVRPDLLGLPIDPYVQHLQFSTNVATFSVPEGTLVVKHGILDAGMQHEFMEAAVPDRRWFLDLDAWNEVSIPFEHADIEQQAIALTDRICSFFSWAMTPAFMEDFCEPAVDA